MKDYPEKQLLLNYLLGICTPREQETVEQWLDQDPENIEILRTTIQELKEKRPYSIPEKAKVKKDLLESISESSSRARKHLVRQLQVRDYWLRIAALFLVVVLSSGAGVYFVYDQRPKGEATADVQPEIIYRESRLANGQTASLRFGDGSVIRLNGGSTLRYPEVFADDRREVFLEGEAFFSIAPDEERPFLVHAGGMTTRVLGTSFNIRAYEGDDRLQVVVAEGKVMVTPDPLSGRNFSGIASRTGNGTHPADSENQVVYLEKNQWMTYHTAGQILEKGEGNIEEMIAWKDRILVFRNKSFGQVTEMLERWYGVNILIEDPGLKDHILEGVHRDVSLEEVLNSIQFVMGFDYLINGNEIVIKKGR